MIDIWDALEYFIDDLGEIGQLSWWYDWGVFVALFIAVASLGFVFVQSKNKSQSRGLTVPQIVAIVALVLVLPSLLIRLFPTTFLDLMGFEQGDADDLYQKLIQWIQGEWDPLEDLRRVKDALTTIAILGWVGTVGSIAGTILVAAGVGGAALGQGQIRCPNCGQVQDISWDYCPYCTPPQSERQQAVSFPEPSGISVPPTVMDPVLPSAAVVNPPTVMAGQTPPAVAWLIVRKGPDTGQQYQVLGTCDIGRDAKCKIRLSDPQSSARHARIRETGGRFLLHDMASTNGTFVNRQRIQRHLLMDGDVVVIGSNEMVFREVRG